jgi:anti-sigma factor RsiW
MRLRLRQRRTEMTCQELVELVTDYFEGALSAGERKRFDEHISSCPWCATYLEQMRETITVLGRLEEESIPPDTRAELLHAFRDWNRESR